MSVNHTLAYMLETSDHAAAFSACSWTYGMLSVIGRRMIAAPAVEAIETAHPRVAGMDP